VAILIHQDIETFTRQIQRVDRRALLLTLHGGAKDTPITVITTYAPHTGYSQKDKKDHWGKVQGTINVIPKKHRAIWRADANGQHGPSEKHLNTYEKIIGPHVNATELEAGNGKSLEKVCEQKQHDSHEHMEKSAINKTRKTTN